MSNGFMRTFNILTYLPTHRNFHHHPFLDYPHPHPHILRLSLIVLTLLTLILVFFSLLKPRSLEQRARMNVGWLDSSLSIMEQVNYLVFFVFFRVPFIGLGFYWHLFRGCASLTPCASGSSTTASTTSTRSTTPTGSIRSTSKPGGEKNQLHFRFWHRINFES